MSLGALPHGVGRPSSDTVEPPVVQIAVCAMFAVFIEFGANRFSRLLDAIAETESFQGMTMID